MKNFLRSIPRNIAHSFWGTNLIWHLVAILATLIIVLSGFDWIYFVSTQNKILQAIFLPAIIIGGLLPIFVPLIIIGIGNYKRNEIVTLTGWTIGQAALLGFIISSFYKSFTGRIQPNLGNTVVDISRQFKFGFLRHGIFWGWPSSHTTVAFAMAFALIYLFPKNKIIKYLFPLYALYIGIGVSMNIHWFSEFVAGAIIGTVIGVVVGKYFVNFKT